jgi:hypothetical protein
MPACFLALVCSGGYGPRPLVPPPQILDGRRTWPSRAALAAVTSQCVARLFSSLRDSVLILFLALVAGSYLARDRVPELSGNARA